MLLATLICSDEDCAEEVELVVEDDEGIARLDVEACACGCTLVVLAIDAWEPAQLPALV